MKKQFSLISVLVIVSLVFLFPGCGKKEQVIGIDDAVELLKKMSQTPLGLTFKAEPANIKIKAGQRGSLITLNEPEITFDTSIYKELGIPMFLKTEKIPMKVKQLDLLYSPKEKYLELLSLKGFSFDWDLSQGNIQGNVAGTLKVSAQDMSFKGYNLSPLLDEKIEDSLGLLMELLKQNPTIQASAHGLNYEMITQVADKEVSFLFGVEEMEWVQKGNAAPLITLFKKGGEKSFDFAGLLSSGSPLFDMEGHFAGLRFSMKQGG
ncbi:MAG: hypothetical protein KAT34_09535, partial [Candidatus Aminicenantes bacterium]|nr:hypothetical protein [Candidatus Aminicenantes bacterium]